MATQLVVGYKVSQSHEGRSRQKNTRLIFADTVGAASLRGEVQLESQRRNETFGADHLSDLSGCRGRSKRGRSDPDDK